jgi:hypothetical protein
VWKPLVWVLGLSKVGCMLDPVNLTRTLAVSSEIPHFTVIVWTFDARASVKFDEIVQVVCRFLGLPPRKVAHSNSHRGGNVTYDQRVDWDALPADKLAAVTPYRTNSPANPQRLNLLQYMTPMAHMVPGIPSRYDNHHCVHDSIG